MDYKSIRKKSRLRQVDVARATGLSQQAISAFERGDIFCRCLDRYYRSLRTHEVKLAVIHTVLSIILLGMIV